MSDDKVAGVATVLYLLFLPLYPVIAAVMEAVSSNVVIAVATVVNVIVTSVYAAFTWGLWRETRAAARTAADQAQTTRQIFEAGHRPYLQIISEHGRVPGGDGQRADHEFRFQFHNHGVVPAIVTRWDMVVMRGERMVHVDHKETREIGSVVGMAVFPESSSYTIPSLTVTIVDEPGLHPEVVATVRYQGAGDRRYVTRLHMVLIITAESVRYFLVDTAIDGQAEVRGNRQD